jgi:single-stranded-DNA-specific exonuclease
MQDTALLLLDDFNPADRRTIAVFDPPGTRA